MDQFSLPMKAASSEKNRSFPQVQIEVRNATVVYSNENRDLINEGRDSHNIIVLGGGNMSNGSVRDSLSYVNKFGVVVPLLEENSNNEMKPKNFGERWDVPPPETCNCRSPSSRPIVFVVRKEGRNFGRYFYRCPDWNSRGCNWMVWVDVWESNNRNRLTKPTRTGYEMVNEGAEVSRGFIKSEGVSRSHTRDNVQGSLRAAPYVSHTFRPSDDDVHDGVNDQRRLYMNSSVIPSENTRGPQRSGNVEYNGGKYQHIFMSNLDKALNSSLILFILLMRRQKCYWR